MASTHTPSTPTKASQRGSTKAPAKGNGYGNGDATRAAQGWLNGSMVAPKKAVDSLLEIQRQWLRTASLGSETLALELKELQQAKDPVEFVSAQFSLANQQMEMFSSQMASLMQQIYDAQLLWIGQWDEKSEEASTAASPVQGESALGALGRMQDEWLKVTQGWIESINSGSHPS